MDSKRCRPWCFPALICYGLVMIWLMFFRFRSGVWVDSSGYWDYVRSHYNLVPFRMIVDYIRYLSNHFQENGLTVPFPVYAAIRNLFGNIGMLIPLGFLLPWCFPKLRKLGRTLLAVAGIIVFLELTQLFTMAGHCDIDDLILNLLGGSLGYGGFCLSCRARWGQHDLRV